MTNDTLTENQINAIQQWATRNGRCWKSELRQAWMTGNYYEADDSASLQQLRNTFGPAWLVRFRLPAVAA